MAFSPNKLFAAAESNIAFVGIELYALTITSYRCKPAAVAHLWT